MECSTCGLYRDSLVPGGGGLKSTPLIAYLGALRNYWEVLLHANCTQFSGEDRAD